MLIIKYINPSGLTTQGNEPAVLFVLAHTQRIYVKGG